MARHRKSKVRRRAISLAGGETAPQRARQGRRTDLEPREDPQRTVMLARKRRGSPDPRDELSESEMGLCILALTSGSEREYLREAWAGLSASWRNYCLRYLGVSGTAQAAAITMIPDQVQSDPSLRVDLRTGEQRDEAAKRAWADWHTRITALPTPMHKWAIRGALVGFLGDGSIWRDGAPTAAGRTAVAALKLMSGT